MVERHGCDDGIHRVGHEAAVGLTVEHHQVRGSCLVPGCRAEQAQQFARVVALVDPPATEAIPLGAEQHLRVELPQPPRRPLGGVVLPAGRPHRPDRRGRQEGHRRLGDIGQVGHDTVAGADAEAAQLRGHRTDAPRQIRPVDLGSGAVLVDADHGRPPALRVTQHLVDVVEGDSREPTGPGHGGLGEHPGVPRRRCVRGADVEELPHRPPETGRLLHRPLPQPGIGVSLGRPVPLGRQLCEPAPLRLGHSTLLAVIRIRHRSS